MNGRSKKLLLHCCCGPCTIYPLEVLRGEGFDVEGLFLNPNIHPWSEYRRRLDALLAYAYVRGLKVITVADDRPETYFRAVTGREEERCGICYELRIRRSLEKARDLGYTHFTTTLLYSPYQRHELIRQICGDLARDHGVTFVYRDFRAGWKEGVRISRRLGMYRQNYCGCLYSERDRLFPDAVGAPESVSDLQHPPSPGGSKDGPRSKKKQGNTIP
ncbi:MAG TPA: epoxyqueuosine reductase QueH [Syntrophales bacterium]|nr:epoxyqueuosine reductase QueH [Syntrophales bacterium]HOM07948.1 epoxyqueuosine reductase QueH [Syntrophales bacterium]HOO00654.1 epoxyqueuosine reductase QueH [Syntrophales bacterium]HPC01908.1 epoxyqueuosine reductase QueH [Syntrophales bacterium]HRS87804.1 epoxyqueuosine reductase QueH [Syntrophales bacterium]